MNTIETRNKKQLFIQYITFKTALTLVGIIVWSYYYILLYKETQSISVLLIEQLVYMLCIFVGFVIGTFYLDKIGYLNSFKISSLMQALSLILIIFFGEHLASMFIIFAIVRGIGNGLYWPVEHSFSLKEMHGDFRGKVISVMQSLALVLQIVLPILSGALITYSGSYHLSFVLGAAIFLFSTFVPFNYNKKSRSQIRGEEMYRIMSNRFFPIYSFLAILNAGVTSLFGVIFLIVPYLILGEELDVGTLASTVGIIAAILALLDSRTSLRRRIQLGYVGFVLYSFFTIVLGLVWSVPILLLRSVGLGFTSSFGDPVRSDLDYRIREKILGEFKSESALEFNLITEALFLIGRIIFLGSFILVFQNINSEDQSIVFMRVLMIIFAPVVLFIYTFFVYLNKVIKP